MTLCAATLHAQAVTLPDEDTEPPLLLPDDGSLTLRPELQALGDRLLNGKRGAIIALDPKTGEVLSLCTNTAEGPDARLAIATAYEPGSILKTAQALTMLSVGAIDENTQVSCYGRFRDGNIRVGCHRHASPLRLVSALAVSCNTWFISTFMSFLNDRFFFADLNEAITTWHDYMTSMSFGGPVGIDLPGEKGGLVANVNYLNRRYEGSWNARTILWLGMGQGDITVTPLQLATYCTSLANRGYYLTPHIHKPTIGKPLANRFLIPHYTMALPDAYDPVIRGMRQAVVRGTCASINTPQYEICGKTGTIENPAGEDHSAFICFAPMEDPKICVAVYVEHGGFGADLAAPMASVILEQYLTGHLSQHQKARLARIEAKRLIPMLPDESDPLPQNQ